MRVLPSLNSLKVFEAAGECLNFTLAAKVLNVTQGAVSRQISQLEDYLGITLFSRAKGKLALTAQGQALLAVIQHSFSEIEREIGQIRMPNLRQRLAILAPPTFCSRWLCPRIHLFTQQYGQYDLQIYTEREEGVSVDIEICFDEVSQAGQHEGVILMEEYIAVCSQALLKDAASLIQGSLANNSHRMLHIRHKGSQLPSWDEWLHAANIPLPMGLHKSLTMSTQEQVINAAVAGGGYAVVDRNMVDLLLKNGELQQFDPTSVPSRFGYLLKIAPLKLGTSKVEDFCAWLQLHASPHA
ncbi:LysR family transcriptional regulator [Aeromonas cavernicola]|uniref:LysR family transcriptional regulator n=1 Tax=Aeromonas cavernicola TaxID=1006623 RepID=A0A2H9U8P5_9GAMM|nr:LysR family transcriptional regulator [Aeromonas cavernicola]PJG60381.1 LysR family transcriptional regulator [Aeromonas cavernicola]